MMPKKKTDTVSRKIPGAELIILAVNGVDYELRVGSRPGEVEPCHTLSHTLRETLGLTGTKVSCDEGVCGASQ
jgi:carbon-monoxide dehydrogenase small subunit